jgi:nucleoside-diphosphate-sugar epimerase
LITGATGKVGNAVARRLVEGGDDVVALVRDPARARELLPARVELAHGDVTDPDSLRAAAGGIEGAFNCMGLFEQWLPDPRRFDRVNAEGARNVVAAARDAGARRVIHTSTFDVFEARQGGTVSERRLATAPKGTAYERSKQLAERLVLAEAADDIEIVICNPSAVVGPGPWAAVGVDGMLRDALRRRLPALPPGGMTLVDVDDVAAGHLAAFARGEPGQRYILADGFATPREIVSTAVEVAGRGWVPPTMPVALAAGLARGGEAVARRIGKPPLLGRGQLTFLLWQARADNSRAREELELEFTPWQQAVRRTVEWMLASGRI